MTNQPSRRTRIASGLTLASTLSSLILAVPAPAAGLPQAGGITFAATIPAVTKPLPLFALAQTAAPTAFVGAAMHGKHAMAMEGSRFVSRDAKGVLQAFADARTGESQIFPDFSASGAAAQPAALTRTAAAVFARPDVIPKDATQMRLGDSTPVFAAAASRDSSGATHATGAPQLLFTYVTADRFAAGLPVTGKGSHVTVGVGNDGSIRAFVRDWKAAVPAGTVVPTASAAQVQREIAAQLQPLQGRYGSISVDSVKAAYYDGDAKFMQPVYEFVATLGARGTLQDHIRGYVPVGKLAEALPIVGQAPAGGPPPTAPSLANAPRGIGKHAMGNPYEITLGQYVNRSCTTGANCLDMANAYLNGFDSVPAYWYGLPIVRTQWLWAYSFEVLGAANYYLNSVNVGYTNPHGDWYLNTTIGNYVPTGDPWYVNQIGTGGNPGFGAAAGGQLATWIVDSCEVIPSFYDKQYTTGNGYNAFNYWWPVFQGLHRALGFRTQMLLGEDTMNYNIARYMAEGANADGAFYNEVAAAGTFPTYYDSHLGLYVHYDRVSTMNDVRNAYESIYSVQGQSAAGSLTNRWMGN
jgi:hypothetical protein